MIIDRLGATPIVMQLPIGAEADFTGVVDLVSMKAFVYPEEAAKGEMYNTVEIPENLQESAAEWRGKLLEAVAENDDAMMELYLEGTEPTQDQLHEAIRRITLASKGTADSVTVTPVFCGTAFKNKGVQPCSTRSCATCLPPGRRGHRGPRREGPGEGHRPQALGRRAVLRPGVQDRERPAPGQAHLRPDLLRSPGGRHRGAELRQGQEGAHRQDLPHAREQA